MSDEERSLAFIQRILDGLSLPLVSDNPQQLTHHQLARHVEVIRQALAANDAREQEQSTS